MKNKGKKKTKIYDTKKQNKQKHKKQSNAETRTGKNTQKLSNANPCIHTARIPTLSPFATPTDMRRLDRVERRLGLLQRRSRRLQLLLGDRLVLGDVVDERLGLVSHFLHLGLDGLGLPRAPRHLHQDLREGKARSI